MSDRLTPFGSAEQAYNLSKVGKSKSPQSLAALMPSREIAAKVGRAEAVSCGMLTRRVVRRSAQG